MPPAPRVLLVGDEVSGAPVRAALERRGCEVQVSAGASALPPAPTPNSGPDVDLVVIVPSAGNQAPHASHAVTPGARPTSPPVVALPLTGPTATPAIIDEAVDRALAQFNASDQRARADRELSVRARQLSGVAEFAQYALTGRDLTELFDRAVRVVVDAIGVPLAAVFEPIPGADLVLLRAGTGWREAAVGQLLHVAEDQSSISRVLRHGTPVSDPGPFVGGRADGILLLKEHDVAAGLAVALPGSNGAQGVLAAYATTPRVFRPEDVHFQQTIANILAGAIDRKTTEYGLLQSQIRLQSVQKMEAIGRLAGGIAHDFNNLVQAIGGYTEILLRRLPESDPLHRNAEEIKKAGDRAAALTRQLLAFSRQQVMQPKVVQLNAVVSNVESLLRRLIGEDVEFETALADDLGFVRADVAQLEQVLMNLAVNSRDAMPDGGTLTIETRNVVLTRADQREAFAINAGPYVMLAVSDTGCGMAPEVRAHAFEPFFTTKPPGHGTGLGLSTVYGIVKQSDGYIWVDSEPEMGTRVRIYLPRVAEPAQGIEVARKAPVSASTPRGHETLLLVEDEEGVRELIAEWLAGHGYTVLTAANGAEALALAAKEPRVIDLLIADVVMPHMGGPALAERLLPSRPGMKVVYVSGYADEAIADPRVLADGADFLQKPFSLDTLVRKVREILDAR
jgi:signal transduction histidine kinase/ActR/RegA family two-component response regulator